MAASNLEVEREVSFRSSRARQAGRVVQVKR